MLQGKHFNSNRFKKNKIDLTNHIKDRKSFGFGSDKFDFSNSLKSINIKHLKFTNYFKSRKDVMFRYTRGEYKKLINNKADLDNDYEMKIVNIDEKDNELKIKELYEKTQNIKLHKFPMMYKLKNWINPNFQLYVINENKTFKVCFIDIYHLAIPTNVEDVDMKYDLNKNNNYCLSNLEDKPNKPNNEPIGV